MTKSGASLIAENTLSFTMKKKMKIKLSDLKQLETNEEVELLDLDEYLLEKKDKVSKNLKKPKLMQ
jgi:hypothetical protein